MLLGGILLLVSATGSEAQEVQSAKPSSGLPAIVNVADDLKNAVVQVRAVGRDGMEAYGTGFVLTDDGFVVTSSDLIYSAKEIKVGTFGNFYPAELMFKGPEPGSIAILQTALHIKGFRVSSHAPNVKDQVSVIGWEAAPRPRLSSIVGSIVDVVGNKIYYSRSSEGRPGITGGPVINEQGEVIGVNIGVLLGSNVAWALNLRSQLSILKKFGLLSEDLATTDTSIISSAEVSCEVVDERSLNVDFRLQPNQRIVDANATIVEQVHVAVAKASVEKVAGSVVTLHYLLQGQPRTRVPLFGVSIGPCDVGHVSILVHARIAKAPEKP
jgi:hypothetical protein